jgi:putative ABC transport system permease protein
VTLDLDRDVPYAQVKDSVELLGYRTFSYAEQFDEIRRFFLYFDMALGLIGLIALITASLGIANTLLMAILERKREIGVLKSLGADERDIRLLFFVESGVIGVVGAGVGIALGWIISRLGSVIARMVMERQGVQPVDFFTVPIWLIGAALFLGTAVSVLAGFYPAARAARVDPVESLRAE